MKKPINDKIPHLLAIHNQGIKLDLGCGEHKADGAIGIDRRPSKGVDIVWDLEILPYPLPDECASIISAANVVQQLKPWLFVDIMNEWWRLLKPAGKLMISTPYMGSFAFHQDPMNVKGFNEATFAYFDPLEQIYSRGEMYRQYRPKPWKIEFNAWSPLGSASPLEVVLSKRKEDPSYYEK